MLFRSSAPAPAAASAPVAAAASAPVQVPGQPPSFVSLIKDTKKIDGLFAAWQKDEKVWLELQPGDFDKPFYLSPKIINGIGEAGLFGGLMSRAVPQLVQFRRVYNQVQLVALNRQQVAAAGSPEARAVAAAASVSLLGSTPVGSQPHPERKSVLIDAGAIFVGEMLGVGATLQRTYRQNYALDGRNSAITQVRGKPDLTVFEVNQHYATGQIIVPVPGMFPPGAPLPSAPEGVPDPRSLFIKLHYSLSRLPEVPMARRAADPRIGHFVSLTDDYSDDLARSPRQRYVYRWRLEKAPPAALTVAAASAVPPASAASAAPAEPAASAVAAASAAGAASAASAPAPASASASASASATALLPPVKPITFWLDRNIPVKYRASISAGVLEWNKAFERLGFAGAVEVKQQPDDADFDTLDMGIASIRWMANRAPQFGAIGPSHVDPRSGEILDADIAIEGLASRSIRNLRARVVATNASALPQADALKALAIERRHVDRLGQVPQPPISRSTETWLQEAEAVILRKRGGRIGEELPLPPIAAVLWLDDKPWTVLSPMEQCVRLQWWYRDLTERRKVPVADALAAWRHASLPDPLDYFRPPEAAKSWDTTDKTGYPPFAAFLGISGTVVIGQSADGKGKVKWVQARQPGNAMEWGDVLAQIDPRPFTIQLHIAQAALARDRATAKPLYEARAGNEGLSSRIGPFLEPLYRAALVDFPATGINPRRVTVPLAP